MAKNRDGMVESTGKIKLTTSDYVIRGIGYFFITIFAIASILPLYVLLMIPYPIFRQPLLTKIFLRFDRFLTSRSLSFAARMSSSMIPAQMHPTRTSSKYQSCRITWTYLTALQPHSSQSKSSSSGSSQQS